MKDKKGEIKKAVNLLTGLRLLNIEEAGIIGNLNKDLTNKEKLEVAKRLMEIHSERELVWDEFLFRETRAPHHKADLSYIG